MEKRLAPVFVENRVIRMTRWRHTIWRRLSPFYIMLADSAGGQLGPPWRPPHLP